MQNLSQNNISLTITSFNQLALLKDALASAINQTIPFHQIIVVDDCSTDASVAYLRKQEKQNQNLTAFRNAKNLGLSGTRNVGMRNATGTYLAFMDGDDWLQLDAHECMLSMIGNDHPDICVFNHQRIGSESKSNLRATFLTDQGLNCTSPKTPEEIVLISRYMPAAWAKIYRFDFLKQNNFWFEGRIYEDFLWNFRCFPSAKSIKCTTKTLINYRIHNESMLASSSARHLDIFAAYESIESFMLENTVPDYYVRFVNWFRFSHVTFVLLNTIRIPKELTSDFAKRILAISSLTNFDISKDELAVLKRVEKAAE